MTAHLLAGAEGALSLSEPFLQYAVGPHWMLNRFYYLTFRNPPYSGDCDRHARAEKVKS